MSYTTIIDIKLKSDNPSYIMASPPNEYRTLWTMNILLISGKGFSIAGKAKKKTIKRKEDKREEISRKNVDMLNRSYSL